MILEYGLGFVAGVLSLLAPCVLPLIPIIFQSSLSTSRWGPIANAIGLTLSFTIVGILTSLFSSIFNIDLIQKVGAVLLILAGVIFVFPKIKEASTQILSGFSHFSGNLQKNIKPKGFISELLMGCVLGMIWGPCSGPTLAFAFGIATQAEKAFQATIIFFFFGLGAGFGLVILGKVLKRFRFLVGKILKHSYSIQFVSGIFSISLGIIILTGYLPQVEEWIIQYLPSWLIKLSVSI